MRHGRNSPTGERHIETVERPCTKCGCVTSDFPTTKRKGVTVRIRWCRPCKVAYDRDYHKRTYSREKGKASYERRSDKVLAYQRSYRQRDYVRAAERAYRQANKERLAAKGRAWYLANRERAAATNRANRLAKRDEYRRRNAAYYRANRDAIIASVMAWRRAHPEYVRKATAQRRARKAAAQGSFTSKEFLAKCDEWGWRCYLCGLELTEDTVTADHRVPLVRGGSNWIENIAPACHACNCCKGTMTDGEYRAVAV